MTISVTNASGCKSLLPINILLAVDHNEFYFDRSVTFSNKSFLPSINSSLTQTLLLVAERLLRRPVNRERRGCLIPVNCSQDIGALSAFPVGSRQSPPIQSASRNSPVPSRGCLKAPPPAPLRITRGTGSARAVARPHTP
jgi:hypothetical protein